MTMKPDTPIRDAASIILLRRRPESISVLMGMRGAKAVFMPSKYVFPGGAVDAADSHAPLARPLPDPHRSRLLAEPRPGTRSDPHAMAAAALRELAEETGLLVGQEGGPRSDWPGYAETGLSPDAGALNYVFRAITPPGPPRRFDARFFALDAGCLSGDARALNLPFITEVVLAEMAELAGSVPYDAPLPPPDMVPFFDNRSHAPRFSQIT